MRELSQEEKMKLTIDIFPLAIQALSNSKKILKRDLTGEWWSLPEHSVKDTISDCDLVLELLRQLGVFVPETSRDPDIIPHITIKDQEDMLKKYNWRQCQVLKYKRSLGERKKHIEEKMQEIIIRYIKKYISSFKKKIIEKYQNGIRVIRNIVNYIRVFNECEEKLKSLKSMISCLPVSGDFSAQSKQVKIISQLCDNCIRKIESVHDFNIKRIDSEALSSFDSLYHLVQEHENEYPHSIDPQIGWEDVY